MALIDNQNKVIYWDEVNWQWLPYISTRFSKSTISYHFRYKDFRIPIRSGEEVNKLLKSVGFKLYPLSVLGITEVSQGYYLYNGSIYYSDGETPIKVLPKLLSKISGKSVQNVGAQLRGRGVVSKEQIEEIMYGKHNTIEFRGKIYNNYSDLSKDYGISISYLYKKLSEGLSLEEVLNVYENSKHTVIDHKGKKHRSVKDMCKAWGITRGVYAHRKNQGWSLKKTLTTPINKKYQGSLEYVDLEGRVFPTIKLMAKKNGVSYAAIMYRIKKGNSPEEALIHLLNEAKDSKSVEDHLGNSFTTKVRMLEYWGVKYDTFRDRLKRGWSLEEALTGKRKKKPKTISPTTNSK